MSQFSFASWTRKTGRILWQILWFANEYATRWFAIEQSAEFATFWWLWTTHYTSRWMKTKAWRGQRSCSLLRKPMQFSGERSDSLAVLSRMCSLLSCWSQLTHFRDYRLRETWTGALASENADCGGRRKVPEFWTWFGLLQENKLKASLCSA